MTDAIAPPRLPLHEVLRLARAESGLSFEQLEGRSYTDRAYLSRLERGIQANPSRDALIRIGIGMGRGIDGINELLKAAGHVPLVRQ